MSTMSELSSIPELPVQSVGSSVSSSLQKEYEELLRYAAVTPKIVVPPFEKVKKLPQYSTTSTESGAESYEFESRDLPKEVSGLPSTPLPPRKAENRGRDWREDDAELSKGWLTDLSKCFLLFRKCDIFTSS